MLLFKKSADLQRWLSSQQRSVGFAPTMGALHEGHLDLVRMAQAAGDLCVVSIFVNPTQFNDAKDLEKYPRTPGKDIALLLANGCDVLFMPPTEEVYPPGRDITLQLDFGQLDKVMEGFYRPGHFGGMATVVNRLLEIVQPQHLYMGQKDLQQLTIVRDMLRQTGSKTRLVMCPTRRESDGVAMSSRNQLLSADMRAIAPAIFRTLSQAKHDFRTQPATKVRETALQSLQTTGFRPEYFDIVDGYTLLPVEQYDPAAFIVACTAAWAGNVRLIDNLVFTSAP